jgi:hypothetical protein
VRARYIVGLTTLAILVWRSLGALVAPCNVDDPPSLVWSNSDLVFGDEENPRLVEKFRSRRERVGYQAVSLSGLPLLSWLAGAFTVSPTP